MDHTTDIPQLLERDGPDVAGNAGLEVERGSETVAEGTDTGLYCGMMAVFGGKMIELHCTTAVLQASGSHLADGWVVVALASPDDSRGSLTAAGHSCSGLSADGAGSLEDLEPLPVELPVLGPRPRYRR